MKITISGTLGSGKSTVAKLLAEKLNYKQYSAGMFTRKIAEERKITLAELTELEACDPTIDKEVDRYQTELGKREDNFVLEGRISFHFVPDSLKVFLKCDEDIAASRIQNHLNLKDTSRMNEGFENAESKNILEGIKKRRALENIRYLKYYGIKQDDERNFDIVIDTTHITAQQACDRILAFREEFLRKKKNNKKNKQK